MHGLFSFWHSNLFEQQIYPTLNGKTSIQKSLDDSDRPQTHIISPGTSDKGKLVGGVTFYSQPTRSLIVFISIVFSLIRFDSTKNLYIAYCLIRFESEM